MPQTLLALMAMMVVTLFSYHQQRNILSMRSNMIRSEFLLQATGVAVDRLEEIGAVSFDEATRSADVDTSSDLTGIVTIIDEQGSYTIGFPADTPGDDIDDFDQVTVETDRITSQDTLRYEVSTDVSYVDETNMDVEVTYATKFKVATVEVVALNGVRPDTLTLSQIYACGSRCTW